MIPLIRTNYNILNLWATCTQLPFFRNQPLRQMILPSSFPVWALTPKLYCPDAKDRQYLNLVSVSLSTGWQRILTPGLGEKRPLSKVTFRSLAPLCSETRKEATTLPQFSSRWRANHPWPPQICLSFVQGLNKPPCWLQYENPSPSIPLGARPGTLYKVVSTIFSQPFIISLACFPPCRSCRRFLTVTIWGISSWRTSDQSAAENSCSQWLLSLSSNHPTCLLYFPQLVRPPVCLSWASSQFPH